MIPRSPVPYGAYDLWSSLTALFDTVPKSTVSLEPIAGGGAKFWASSGRQALWLILESLLLPPRSRIALPLYGDIGIAEAIFAAGHQPVFVDVDEETLTMNPEALEAVRDSIAAVIVVHVFGHMARMDEILDIAGDLPVIEDAVHAPMSSWRGRRA